MTEADEPSGALSIWCVYMPVTWVHQSLAFVQ